MLSGMLLAEPGKVMPIKLSAVVEIRATWCTLKPQTHNTKKFSLKKISYIFPENFYVIFWDDF